MTNKAKVGSQQGCFESELGTVTKGKCYYSLDPKLQDSSIMLPAAKLKPESHSFKINRVDHNLHFYLHTSRLLSSNFIQAFASTSSQNLFLSRI